MSNPTCNSCSSYEVRWHRLLKAAYAVATAHEWQASPGARPIVRLFSVKSTSLNRELVVLSDTRHHIAEAPPRYSACAINPAFKLKLKRLFLGNGTGSCDSVDATHSKSRCTAITASCPMQPHALSKVLCDQTRFQHLHAELTFASSFRLLSGWIAGGVVQELDPEYSSN